MRIMAAQLLYLCAATALAARGAAVHVSVADVAGNPLTVRMHIRDAQGVIVEPPSTFFRRDYIIFESSATLNLDPGAYRYEIEHGPEFSRAEGALQVTDTPVHIRARLKRLADLAQEGWWSGDVHTHRELEDMPLLTAAEDIHIAPVITWWNDKTRWDEHPLPDDPLTSLLGGRFVHAMAGEDERNGGALLFFNLANPIPIAGAAREHPSPVEFARMARRRGAHIDIEKPFWWDVPTWLALDLADTIGLANNHMCRASMYESEAWGKPRDTDRLPPPRGNGFWTQEIYYHILNAGLRVPPSAGSAAGVLPNPVGYNRVYIHLDEPVTYAAWWNSLREGKSFVTNGPLLRVMANGRLPGHVFKNPETIFVDAHLTTDDPVNELEVICNGKIAQVIPVHTPDDRLQFTIASSESGWFLIRAIADVPHTFRFASTAPFYIERRGERQRISRDSCQFFLDWVRERMDRISIDDAEQYSEVLRWHRKAEKFWSNRLKRANAE